MHESLEEFNVYSQLYRRQGITRARVYVHNCSQQWVDIANKIQLCPRHIIFAKRVYFLFRMYIQMFYVQLKCEDNVICGNEVKRNFLNLLTYSCALSLCQPIQPGAIYNSRTLKKIMSTTFFFFNIFNKSKPFWFNDIKVFIAYKKILNFQYVLSMKF